MSSPNAVRNFHFGKDRFERRIFGRAGVYAETNGVSAFEQMTNAHLFEIRSVERVFYEIIRIASVQTIPNGVNRCAYVRCRPIGIAVICDHAAQSLKTAVFIFDGRFQPIVAVQVHNNSALVESALAFKLCPNNEGKEIFFRCELQNGSIVVSKTVISPLP